MANNIYIAKQPILKKDGDVFAYELLYRDSEDTSNIKNRKQATVSVLSSVINKFGIDNLLSNHKAFVKADEEFIMHSIVNTIPKEYFIFSLQFDEKVSPKAVKKVKKLYEDGYTFAINDVILDKNVMDNYKDIMEYISYVKVDIDTPADNYSLLNDLDIEVISTKVENSEKEKTALQRDVDYLQGYFFCKPAVKKQEKFDAEVENVIRLCNRIMQDCSVDDLVDEFERSPVVSMQLLKFINSGLFHFRQKLSSIKQVLTLVGKTKLTQWLMLMIYSTPRGEGVSNEVLFERVKSRTYIMNEIAKIIDRSIVSNAYFVGVISLMDALFSISKRSLMQQLNVDKEIKDAILKKDGILGDIYSFVLALESFNTETIDNFIEKYNISKEALEQITLNASKDLGNIE
ncbi:EAL and HDOD domain-containing protein [Sulfurimonas sp.]|uniref:EAL and HDOD domain-containing protein n=1 Tax=Sulfurimonas sp. TaxID=2022749 RepID=UPI003564B2A0